VQRYSLTHLSNEVLRRELSDKAAKEKEATAELLAHIAEFDARRLYLPAGYESMFAYCVGELGLSEDATKKRIRAARAGHRCPCVFEALAEGRVHLSGIVLMAAHLQPETVLELLAAAAHQTKDEIERMLVERFPRPAVAAHVEQIPAAPLELAAVEGAPGPLEAPGFEGSPGNPHARVTPLSAEAFAVQFTRSGEAHERFRYLQDLLGHKARRGGRSQGASQGGRRKCPGGESGACRERTPASSPARSAPLPAAARLPRRRVPGSGGAVSRHA
jgi:hypothetical protein